MIYLNSCAMRFDGNVKNSTAFEIVKNIGASTQNDPCGSILAPIPLRGMKVCPDRKAGSLLLSFSWVPVWQPAFSWCRAMHPLKSVKGSACIPCDARFAMARAAGTA
jgi:hypothetical protein